MDAGRQIDHMQNVNAMQYDRFRKNGKTSTRIMHPPGGECHFSIGWGVNENSEPIRRCGKKRYTGVVDQFMTSQEKLQENEYYENFNKNYRNFYKKKGHYGF